MAKRPALLVIDAQNAFYDGSKLSPVHDADTMLSRIPEAIAEAQAYGVAIILVQHDGRPGHPLEPHTAGWQLHASLRSLDVPVVRKHRSDSFFETDLKDRLDEIDASRLIIVGNQTEFCIDTTCRRAVSEGYGVTLFSDCHSTWPSEALSAEQIIAHHNHVLGRQFVSSVTSSEFDWSQA